MSFMASLTHGMPPPVSMAPGAAQTGSQHYMSRVPSLPENMYTSLQYPSQRPADDNANYYNAAAQSKMKAASSLGSHYFVDHMMNPHPYSSLYPGFDINAVRRKNATREITGPLKAWLSQHKKNPYPTKGEKVMLAIATRMTLTQVSTWFANARRRMKKDNLSDDEDDSRNSGDEIRQRSGSLSSRSQASSEADVSRESDISRELDHSDTEEQHVHVGRTAKKCVQRLFSPDLRTGPEIAEPASSPESLPTSPEYTNIRLPSVSEMMSSIQFQTKPLPVLSTDSKAEISQKPKIWSISEIINPAGRSTIPESSHALPQGSTSLPSQSYANTYSTYNNHGYPSNDTSYLYQNASHAGYTYSADYNGTSGAPSAVQYL